MNTDHNSLLKGNALEAAVRAIEETILQSSPSLREGTFTIESKKLVTVAGVRHEIDLYVEVDLSREYRAIFIFECKNWRDSVGKNEVIIFSEKIKAVAAQRGFFIANSLTSDAVAQAVLDPRVSVLKASELPPSETPVPFNFHFVLEEKAEVEFVANQRGGSSSKRREPLQLESTSASLNSVAIKFRDYISDWVSHDRNENLRTFNSAALPEGTYERQFEAFREFAPGELILNDMDIDSIKLTITRHLRIVRPPVISHFEVETRGRSIAFAPIPIGDGAIKFGMVGIEQATGCSEPTAPLLRAIVQE